MRVAREKWGLEEAILGRWDVERTVQSIVQEEGSRRRRKGRMRKRIPERGGKRCRQLSNTQTLTKPQCQGGEGTPAGPSQRTEAGEVNPLPQDGSRKMDFRFSESHGKQKHQFQGAGLVVRQGLAGLPALSHSRRGGSRAMLTPFPARRDICTEFLGA